MFVINFPETISQADHMTLSLSLSPHDAILPDFSAEGPAFPLIMQTSGAREGQSFLYKVSQDTPDPLTLSYITFINFKHPWMDQGSWRPENVSLRNRHASVLNNIYNK